MLMQSEVPGAGYYSLHEKPFLFCRCRSLLHMLGLTPLPFPADLSPREVDGSWEHLWQPLHHAEWRLVLWHPALGDLFPWYGPNSSLVWVVLEQHWKEDAVFFKLWVVNNVKIPGVSQVEGSWLTRCALTMASVCPSGLRRGLGRLSPRPWPLPPSLLWATSEALSPTGEAPDDVHSPAASSPWTLG